MTKTTAQFGAPIPGVTYRDCPSVNAVIFNDSHPILAIRPHDKLFLHGGGIEAGESVAEALAHECHSWAVRHSN